MTKIPIITVGLAHSAGGFSRVFHSIAEHLSHRYEIHHLAVNLDRPPTASYPFRVYGNGIADDALGEIKLQEMIHSLCPRLVWMLNDFWFLGRYHRVLRDLRGEIPTIAYLPLDGRIQRTGSLWALGLFDTVVLYNRFSKRELSSALRGVASRRPGFEAPRLEIIPHGVDTEKFSPLGPSLPDGARRREISRRSLFGGSWEPEDAFLVLNANQNATRKRLDVTLRGFALFARRKPPGVKLYLHCASVPGSRRAGFDLPRLAEELGIRQRLLFTREGKSHPGVSDRELNLLYNACDVGLNTSFGEGWGLISFEHGATRAAQVVPDHTACGELWQGSAELLPTHPSPRPPGAPLEARDTTPEAVAEALERLYADRDHRRAMAQAAYDNATRPRYLWKNVAERWHRLFSSRIKEYGRMDPMPPPRPQPAGVLGRR